MSEPAKKPPLMPAPAFMPLGEVLHLLVAPSVRVKPVQGLLHFSSRDGMTLTLERPAQFPKKRRLAGLELAAGNAFRLLYAHLWKGKPAIGIADSPDLVTWRIVKDAAIEPANPWYERDPKGEQSVPASWADPFLLFDRETRTYRAFVGARRSRGGRPSARACIATAVSSDMSSWQVLPPVFAPGTHGAMGAPFLLEGGDRFHLIYHTMEEDGAVSVRRAESGSVAGPFDPVEPQVMFRCLNGCARPAVFRGIDSVFVVPGGLAENAAGTHHLVPTLMDFSRATPEVKMHPVVVDKLGDPRFRLDTDVQSDETVVRLLPRRADNFVFSAAISVNARRVGLVVCASVTGKRNYTVWLDTRSRCVSLHEGTAGKALLEAPCGEQLREKGKVKLTIMAGGPVVTAYVSGALKLVVPRLGRRGGGFGLAVDRGAARFSNVTLYPLR